jgi:hypothetical protein
MQHPVIVLDQLAAEPARRDHPWKVTTARPGRKRIGSDMSPRADQG